MASDRERIATLEEGKRNTEQAVHAIFEYMREGREWREETSKCLVKLVQNQEGMFIYQEHCDADRDNMAVDARALEKRVTVTEGFQKRQMKYGFIFALLFGGSGVAAPKVFQKIMELFS